MKNSIKISALYKIAIFAGLFLVSTNLQAQNTSKHESKTRILFLFDGSQSMFGKWQSGMKIDVSKKLLTKLVDSLRTSDNLQLALRAYGHQFLVRNKGNRNCEDTKLEVPFSKNNHDALISKINSIRPSGTTPIAYSLLQAANDFPPCKDCRNIIILITDGIEECDGDPCAVAEALLKKGITLKPFVIGIGMLDDNLKKQFECVGTFFDAQTEQNFTNILNVVISQAMDNTTSQVNLLDASGKPTETDVNMTFYDNHTGTVKYNFVHTINDRGNPDTLTIDPSYTYNITAHTIPPVSIQGAKINPGKHTIIAIDTPQGELELKIQGDRNQYKDLKTIIRKKGELKTLHIQDFDTKEKYITGLYDLEILTQPRTYLTDVKISQSHTTKIEIPQAGIVSFLFPSSGHGGIYKVTGNQLELVIEFNPYVEKESITLQPGKYMSVFRPKKFRDSDYTQQIPFTIDAGRSQLIKF